MTTFEPSSRIDSATSQVRWNTSYVAIPRPLIREPSFAKLKGNAVKLLLAMVSGYVGNNNGELIATFPVMKTYGFNSKDAVAKALGELLRAGMIIRTRQSDYRRAATYAVTWLPVNKPGSRGPYDPGVSPSEIAEDRWRQSGSRVPPAVSVSKSVAPLNAATAAPVAAPSGPGLDEVRAALRLDEGSRGVAPSTIPVASSNPAPGHASASSGQTCISPAKMRYRAMITRRIRAAG